MAHLTRLAETVSDRKKQQCFLELNELVRDLQSTSLNGMIRSVPKQPRGKERFTTVLRVDGMLNKWIDQDVDTKTDCLLELGKLHSVSKAVCENRPHCNDDSDDETILTLAEIAEISASYFVSFGVQVSNVLVFCSQYIRDCPKVKCHRKKGNSMQICGRG